MEENKKEDQAVVDNASDALKIKPKMKNFANKQSDNFKVDLNKPIEPVENEIKKDNPINEGVVGVDENADSTEEQEEVQPKEQAQEETPILEEVTEEEVVEEAKELTEEIIDAKIEAAETGKAIPENLQTVIDFRRLRTP
mgnify:FL=1